MSKECSPASAAEHFVKLSAPWELLGFHAGELSGGRGASDPALVPQARPNPDLNGSAELLQRLRLRNPLQQHVPNKPLNFCKCPFAAPSWTGLPPSRWRLHSGFPGGDSHDSYFSNTRRHRVVPGADLNPPPLLYLYWAGWGCWHKYQPLDHIREYSGEKVAIYFAWLGFYTAWLLLTPVGTLVFISGLVTTGTNIPAEICASGGAFLTCPLCDTCATWNISEICSMAKGLAAGKAMLGQACREPSLPAPSQLGYLFDHPGTMFFSTCMSFWAMAFLEHWKQAHWDCSDFQEKEPLPGYLNFTLAPAPPAYLAQGNYTPCRSDTHQAAGGVCAGPGHTAGQGGAGRGGAGRAGAQSRPSRPSPNPAPCRYKVSPDAQGNLTLFYWKLRAVRLGFIIAFEVCVGQVQVPVQGLPPIGPRGVLPALIAWLAPGVPAALATRKKRECSLAKQALADNRQALPSVRCAGGPGPTPTTPPPAQ
ncbi:Anoctamin-7, partial [Galemys pyrenaicus]